MRLPNTDCNIAIGSTKAKLKLRRAVKKVKNVRSYLDLREKANPRDCASNSNSVEGAEEYLHLVLAAHAHANSYDAPGRTLKTEDTWTPMNDLGNAKDWGYVDTDGNSKMGDLHSAVDDVKAWECPAQVGVGGAATDSHSYVEAKK